MLRFKKDDGTDYPEWEEKRFDEVFNKITDYVAAGSFADIAKNVSYINTPNHAQLVRTVDVKKNFKNKDFVYIDENAYNYLWRVNLDNEKHIILPNIGANIGEFYLLCPENLPYKNNVLGPNAILLGTSQKIEFWNGYFETRSFQKKLSLIVAASGQPKFNKTELKGIKVPLPTLEEQQKIADFLSSVDQVITCTEKELENLELQKKGAMQKLFSQEVRFKDDNGTEYPEWEEKKITEICDTVTDYVAAGSFGEIAKHVKYLESGYAQLIRTTDLKNDFKSKDFIYVDKDAFEFLWRVNLNKEGIILPNVGNCGEVYYFKPENFLCEFNALAPNSILVRSTTNNNRFLSYLFKYNDFQKKLKLIVSPTGQTKFNKTEFKNISCIVPCLEEQQKIADFLSHFDTAIDLTRQELEQWKLIKKGLLQQMFK